MRRLAALGAVLLQACASGAVVSHGDGPSISSTQLLPVDSGRYRIAVGALIDKTAGAQSLSSQLAQLNRDRAPEAHMQVDAVTSGLHDLLLTELFQADRFIVLERAALDAVLTEQEFSESADAGAATRIPTGQLEGADLILVGAITAFDAGAEGGALPIPIPLGNRGDFGIMRLRMARGHVSLDLRVIDARTARVLSSVAVEGRNTRFGFDFDLRLESGNSRIRLPGALQYFQNTPVEKALQEMVSAAVAHVVAQLP